MPAQRVIRYLTEVEHAIDNYVDDLPYTNDNIKVTTEFVPAGQIVLVSTVDDDGVIEEVELWAPPGKSTATRLPPARTKGHSRGYLVDTRTNRAVSFASTYEMTCALMLLTNSSVVDIEDQPPALHYIAADGTEHKHTFDYRATLRDGVRIAFAVKPRDQVKSSGIEDVILRIKPNLRGFADAAVLITDRTLTRERAWNAKWTLRALKIRDEADCEKMRTLVSDINGIVSAYELARKFERFADGLNAIWCLVYDGVLELAEPGKKLVDAPWVKSRHGRS
ncbi:TnsA endonuclease N-terminal domain-containing protein [Agrobacterium sp. V1]|uniref:TnsA endonuclease N-terminal domain-containing protein n=1 Tax=Agrobacterium sp. V1 TaxID=3061957 RepID=UPI002672B0A3|nr:TnsA endonuclease N-terminal domain-containing protein [Agrobacterium sp. V1]MDO3441834.1 hypothetical protein [Agrobacterium sp. V1]